MSENYDAAWARPSVFHNNYTQLRVVWVTFQSLLDSVHVLIKAVHRIELDGREYFVERPVN